MAKNKETSKFLVGNEKNLLATKKTEIGMCPFMWNKEL